jgi:hypothetical protein
LCRAFNSKLKLSMYYSNNKYTHNDSPKSSRNKIFIWDPPLWVLGVRLRGFSGSVDLRNRQKAFAIEISYTDILQQMYSKNTWTTARTIQYARQHIIIMFDLCKYKETQIKFQKDSNIYVILKKFQLNVSRKECIKKFQIE